MKQIYTTTLRLNLADEDDRRAYEHLQRMDKKQYRSYSKAIVTAINDHFERQALLASDPYLETRAWRARNQALQAFWQHCLTRHLKEKTRFGTNHVERGHFFTHIRKKMTKFAPDLCKSERLRNLFINYQIVIKFYGI